jgi:hypothetical protein
MSKSIFHVGDKVILHDNGATEKGVVELIQGSQVTIKTNDGRTLTRDATFLTHARSSESGRRVLPAPPIGERRILLSQAVEMVANGIAPSLIVVGQPGLGKTHEIVQTLRAMGLEPDHDYFYVKGYTSPRGLYETLYANNGRLTVFDDCDAALNDGVSVELLKGALDSHQVRTISWLTAAKGRGNLPKSFQFEGRVIFVSNRALTDIDESIHARSLVIDYCMSRDEILEHMETILPLLHSDTTPEQRRSGMQFIRKWAPCVKQLNLRTLVSVLRIITAHPTNWERLAVYTVTQ